MKAKRWVVGDIHGCPKTLEKLLFEECKIRKQDKVFFLGDYIHRGPDSQGVIDFISQLKIDNYNVRTLMGNHEAMEVELFHSDSQERFNFEAVKFIELIKLKENREELSNKFFSDFAKKNKEFFFDLEFYIELEDFYLVHAGFDISSKEIFEDYYKMIWTRKWEYNIKIFNNKRIIVGHTPKVLDDIQLGLNNDIIFLDGGCVFKHHLKLGYLCCFELNKKELYFTKNID